MKATPKRTRAINRLTKLFLFMNVVLTLCIGAGVFKFRREIRNQFFPHEPATVVMFGNSLTRNGDWERLLGREDIANEGTGGFTTSHFVWLMQESVIERNPKICFIEGGINDLGVGIPLARTVENITTIIDTLQQHDIIPVLNSTIYTSNDTLKNHRVDSLNLLVKELAGKKNVRYCDLNDKLSANHLLKEKYTTDGIHLTEPAYTIWADKVKTILAEHKL